MKNELVSALLDGECSALELRAVLDEAHQSPELMRQWSRMVQVRDVLAGRPVQRDVSQESDLFCAAVMSQLGEMEPASDLTFAAAPAINMPNGSNVIPLRTRPHDGTPRRIRRPLVGWAAAASVTLVALAGGRAWIGDGSQKSSDAAVSSRTSSGSADDSQTIASVTRDSLVPVSSQTYPASSDEPAEVRWAQLDPATASELNSYMIEHNNSRAEQGMSGELGYARLAARNVGYRPANESR